MIIIAPVCLPYLKSSILFATVFSIITFSTLLTFSILNKYYKTITIQNLKKISNQYYLIIIHNFTIPNQIKSNKITSPNMGKIIFFKYFDWLFCSWFGPLDTTPKNRVSCLSHHNEDRNDYYHDIENKVFEFVRNFN